ncbi:outer membrane protein assembly factor BamD [Blastochloris viridis]|nr:outer membrane protein assembly factor BamD [Blastochloris viridis]ALK08211.1 Outer membrane protein assembly factor BamD precursor [Blastochloris viridis]CUU44133.1 Competence lipoprotein ComL precursor [Blastochloris viridis]
MRRSAPLQSRLRTVIRGLAIGLLAVSLAACAIFDKKPEQLLPDEPADRLYNEGLTLVAKKEYKAAAKKFEEIDRQHPYSEWARKALLMTAFVHYEASEYDEAVTSAKRYVALHPGSPDVAYAQYLVGASYFDQIADITRDQARTERAIQALDEVVRKYPDSEYAESAKRKITIARDQLAGKEMAVGRYYQEKRNYIGAINRFKTVVIQYQTTRQVEEALMRLVECYMAMGITHEAQTAAAVLGHNFPDSPWYKDAYKLLQSGGLEPREDQGSWISRSFKKLGLG